MEITIKLDKEDLVNRDMLEMIFGSSFVKEAIEEKAKKKTKKKKKPPVEKAIAEAMDYSDPPFQSVSETLTKFKDSLMEVNEMDGKEALETVMTMMKSEFDIDNFQNLDPSRHAEIIKYLEEKIVE